MLRAKNPHVKALELGFLMDQAGLKGQDFTIAMFQKLEKQAGEQRNAIVKWEEENAR